MRITQEGDYIRFQLYEKAGSGWKKQFDFTIRKNDFVELKQDMIETLNKFEVK